MSKGEFYLSLTWNQESFRAFLDAPLYLLQHALVEKESTTVKLQYMNVHAYFVMIGVLLLATLLTIYKIVVVSNLVVCCC